MHVLFETYLGWLRATNHAEATVRNGRTSLRHFRDWCDSRAISHPAELTLENLEEYRLALFAARTRRGTPLGWGTQAEYLGGLKAFMGWSAQRGIIPRNPAVQLVLPRRPVQLPLAILNAREVERVLRLPDRTTSVGLRDRTILELFYSTGIRRAELVHLRVGDIDSARGVVLVRAGKGRRDRVVPCGRRALSWVRRYVQRARTWLRHDKETEVLFLTTRGRPLRLNRLSERVRSYVEAAGLAKSGSCHLFRHTMATLLLEGGADVRDVQEILGHTNLSTTARYTHISIARLQAVHARAHPAEQKARRRRERREATGR